MSRTSQTFTSVAENSHADNLDFIHSENLSFEKCLKHCMDSPYSKTQSTHLNEIPN